MRISILFLTVAASLFPFVQLIPIDSYLQPYAFIFSVMACVYCLPYTLRNAPVFSSISMIAFAFAGVILFIFALYFETNAQDIKSLLMYLSPLFFYCVGFTFSQLNINLFRNLTIYSALVWIFVGVVQTIVTPDFATNFVGQWSGASTVVVESGRGVLSLAPEPTHHGFHMLLLAALLYSLNSRRAYVLCCILASIFMARSSSAILALSLGYILLYILNPIRMLPISVVVCLLISGVLAIFINKYADSDIRFISLLSNFFEDPTRFLSIDSSVNSRIGGLVAGVDIVLNNYLIPFGMSNNEWLRRIPVFLSDYIWLFDLSPAGLPSGIFIIIYQMGLLGAVFVLYFFYVIVSSATSIIGRYLFLVTFAVFLSQFLLSFPIFGLIYGCAVSSKNKKYQKNNFLYDFKVLVNTSH